MDPDVNFCDMPVYRSVDISSIRPSDNVFGDFYPSDNDFFAPPPRLEKSKSPSESIILVPPRLEKSKAPKLLDSLHALLDSADFVQPGCLPSIDDLGFNPLCLTHSVFSASPPEVTQLIEQYLAEQAIFSEYFSSKYRWVCHLEQEHKQVKFQIQLYSRGAEVVAEFMRLHGCSMIFSNAFRCFKGQSVCNRPPVSDDSHHSVSPPDLDNIVSWVKSDQCEGVSTICSLISQPQLMKNNRSAIVDMLVNCSSSLLDCSESIDITHPSLTLTSTLLSVGGEDFLSVVDTLVPCIVRSSQSSDASSFMKSRCAEVLEKRIICT
jgi:hypothetical protein